MKAIESRDNSRLAFALNAAGLFLFFVAVVNFLAFGIAAVSLGGDALNGKAEGGHYYLAHRGNLTEVSESVWTYSRIHSISVIITHVLGILGGGGLMTLAQKLKARNKTPAGKIPTRR
jgi:hypothetical protein